MGMRRCGYSVSLHCKSSPLLVLVPFALQLFALAGSDVLPSTTIQGVVHTASSSTFDTTKEEYPPEVHCSRERSRAAWNIIEKYLLPFVDREKYQLPTHCRLHPSNDIFREQEEHKIHFDLHEWRCGYCKKSFYKEEYLDMHFDNRHYHLLNASHGKCLADLCGALHCDYLLNSQSQKTKCNPAASGRNRHLCEELANSCFPLNTGPLVTRLHEVFIRQFCDAHSCSKSRKFFPMGGNKGINTAYVVISVLVLLLLPVFYLIVYAVQREMRTGTQQLKHIKRKAKPS